MLISIFPFLPHISTFLPHDNSGHYPILLQIFLLLLKFQTSPRNRYRRFQINASPKPTPLPGQPTSHRTSSLASPQNFIEETVSKLSLSLSSSKSARADSGRDRPICLIKSSQFSFWMEGGETSCRRVVPHEIAMDRRRKGDTGLMGA